MLKAAVIVQGQGKEGVPVGKQVWIQISIRILVFVDIHLKDLFLPIGY